MGKDSSSNARPVGQRSTKPDLRHLAAVTELPARDDARSNGGKRALQHVDDDTGYPDWQGEQAGYDPGEYDAGEEDDDEDDGDGDDSEEEMEDESDEDMEPPPPPRKTRRSQGKGKRQSVAQDKGKGKGEHVVETWPPVLELLQRPQTVKDEVALLFLDALG